MKPIVKPTIKEIQMAWKAFNDLPTPQTSSMKQDYMARDAAWRVYTGLRDRYLDCIGYQSRSQIWYDSSIDRDRTIN